MSSDGEVTLWLRCLKDGDRDAAQPLWEKYYRRLVGLAGVRLRGAPRACADEEDVALSAFDSFCRRAEKGHFPRLNDRKDLWQLLVMIAERKVCDLIQHEKRARRDVGRRCSLDAEGAEKAFGKEPEPVMVAQVTEELTRLLALLPSETYRTIAWLKLESYTNQEIAQRIKCAVSTVERKLNNIRSYWKRELPSEQEV